MKQAKINVKDLTTGAKTDTICKFVQAQNANIVEYCENEQSGLGNTRTILEFSNSGAEIKRVGEVEMKMVFAKGKTYFFPITTNYGDFDGCVKTSGYYMLEKEDKYVVRINYSMSLDKVNFEQHKIKIEIEK